jgi:hypothetical protein
MKTIHRNMLLAAIAAVIALGAMTPASADYYRHDNRGYWDGHHHYHSWVYYHNHRGYWDERNGVQVFINL